MWADPVSLLPDEAASIAQASAADTNTSTAIDAVDSDANVNASATDNADSNDSASTAMDVPMNAGTGLKPPQDDAQDQDKTVGTSVVAPASHAAKPSVPAGTRKSLTSTKRSATDKLRLGRELDEGIASWYGPRFHGRRTASGERFDRYALTAAHKTLPLGTRVVVSNLRTGKQIVVRINDRGPYLGHRVLDLSEAAANALGLKTRGLDWVVMNEVLSPSDAPDTVTTGAAAQASDSPVIEAAVAVAQDVQPANPLSFKPPAEEVPAAPLAVAAAVPAKAVAEENVLHSSDAAAAYAVAINTAVQGAGRNQR